MLSIGRPSCVRKRSGERRSFMRCGDHVGKMAICVTWDNGACAVSLLSHGYVHIWDTTCIGKSSFQTESYAVSCPRMYPCHCFGAQYQASRYATEREAYELLLPVYNTLNLLCAAIISRAWLGRVAGQFKCYPSNIRCSMRHDQMRRVVSFSSSASG